LGGLNSRLFSGEGSDMIASAAILRGVCTGAIKCFETSGAHLQAQKRSQKPEILLITRLSRMFMYSLHFGFISVRSPPMP
jgi:hypothetical protein